MKIYHQLGHNHLWAFDAYEKHNIGDGFIFTAYSFKYGTIGEKLHGISPAKYLTRSMIDLQYYGKKDSIGGQLATYPFNPVNIEDKSGTRVGAIESIVNGVEYQIELGLKNIIVPIFYYEASDQEKIINLVNKINKSMKTYKKKYGNNRFFLTLPLSNDLVKDPTAVENILEVLTDMNICFDGYYIVCDYSPGYKMKTSIDYDYYKNLSKIFSVLNQQDFKSIYGYANWDALIFTAMSNIDYVTIGTYENLRRFNIKRFLESPSGGPSKGWYFSEKLLNFIRAEDLTLLRSRDCLDLIANDKNIFSDIILDPKYIWSSHKPDVHKNYLLSISRLLSTLAKEDSFEIRKESLLKRVQTARKLYSEIENDFKVYLDNESSNYHLGTWATFLKST
ncbi:hypothetical protein ER57_13315 [Smithella sp. SCADC]|jgi:hypothetical protein|nr:hypothetical protein ER57_13315 [Smithella sp. SCADC]HAR48670.1 hypothetical protein [Smithella sp.]